jgi:hypothetical protein
MIINLEPHNFGGQLRAGDLIGVLNYMTYIQSQYSDELKLHIPDRSVNSASHCLKFRDWLNDNVPSILSKEYGDISLNLQNVNLWDYRSITGDVLKLKFNRVQKKKICIFPLLDAPYNNYRNWSVEMVQSFIEHYSQPQYEGYEKIVCSRDNHFDFTRHTDWTHSSDYITNIEHIVDCSHFVGGDTGTSHFVSVVDDNKIINYYYGSVGLLHTTPFYALQGKGNINLFWNNNWRIDLL